LPREGAITAPGKVINDQALPFMTRSGPWAARDFSPGYSSSSQVRWRGKGCWANTWVASS